MLPRPAGPVYATVEARAPGATVAVTGYPRLFNGTDCNPLTFFTAAEMARINTGTDELNTRDPGTRAEAGRVSATSTRRRPSSATRSAMPSPGSTTWSTRR